MAPYSEKLLKSAYHIQSIVFPQRNVPIDQIYEPLSVEFNSYTPKSKTYSTDDLLNLDRHFQVIDDAGMGKTTFLKHLAMQAFRKTEKIPIILYLRNYDQSISIAENLCRELDCIGNKFDRNLFNHLINAGKFFIFLDGFDEASAEAQPVIRKAIEAFCEQPIKSRICVTSRPQDNVPIVAKDPPFRFLKLRRQNL